ncbi:MAG TPA: ABC transporter ATP-binding protein [Thermoanaerobaculia bacterium]|nr:ABC transporter ATP-binding protein [Thermoanaerobaculia bacterium]
MNALTPHLAASAVEPGTRQQVAADRALAATPDRRIVLDGVSKFYGEVLGVNRVSLSLEPGITGLVGPNGSGKTTLMNLMAGLLTPDQGSMSVLGLTPAQPEELFRLVGYSTQYDGFPRGVTGFRFVHGFLRLHGYSPADAEELAWQAIERVGLVEAARRKAAGYSKGMRQRIRLAQAIAHRPAVLILDEPLNGLDPMARAEMIDLFRHQADEGLHVLISSHILHEVDDLSDQVVLINGGYVVAEGEIEGVRGEVEEQPLQVLVRCERPATLARLLFSEPHVTEVSLHADGAGLFVRSTNADQLYLALNRVFVEEGLAVEAVAPADADVGAVYQYLIGGEEMTR